MSAEELTQVASEPKVSPAESGIPETEAKKETVEAETDKETDKAETDATEKDDKKRPADASEGTKRKARRRQYDDLPKEEPESDDEDKENAEEPENDDEDDEEDNLAEIDQSNIITGGRRTRGKVVDYRKAAEDFDEDDEDEDGEFDAKDDEN